MARDGVGLSWLRLLGLSVLGLELMIFVTVGTHEQPFDRLIKAIDALAREGVLEESVLAQIGYCTYEPTCCDWKRFMPALVMRDCMETADIVITHGGPSSFVEAMVAGKVPIVAPRYKEFGEHVNDHQEAFVRLVADRLGGIIPVYDTANLGDAIKEARRKSAGGTDFKSHNAAFCKELCKRIDEM